MADLEHISCIHFDILAIHSRASNALIPGESFKLL